MFEYQAIDHLVLRVRDIDRMLHFYTEVLGCHLEKAQTTIGLYQLRAGSGLIDLLVDDVQDEKPAHHNLDHFCLRLKNFDAEAIRARLEQHGVAVGEVASRYGAEGQGPSIYISDPEGNQIELKAPPAAGDIGPTENL